MAPSSFASALAGNNQNDSAAREGSSEWSRSRTNGATHTFRRSSTAVSLSNVSQPPEPVPAAGPPPRYVPPHRNGTLSDMRYSKDQLLDLFRAQNSSGAAFREDLSQYYVGSFRPDSSNGAGSTNAPSNRSEQSRDAHLGPEICWDKDHTVEPLGLTEMDDEERELFATSVNTPLKPPSSANKDGHQSNGMASRKFSVSGQTNAAGNAGPLSPTYTRGPTRRRETSESYPFPVASAHEEQRAPSPPPSLLRRTTDLRDASKLAEYDEADEKSTWSPFGTLKRTTTGPLSGGTGAPSSPWSNAPQNSGLAPMGSFGSFGLGQQQNTNDKRPGLGSGRSESRFKSLLTRESGEEPGAKSVERKSSMSSLTRVNENESWRPQQDRQELPLDEVGEDMPSGSAALTADPEGSPSLPQTSNAYGFGTPSRGEDRDDFGFGAFGMTAENVHSFVPGFSTAREGFGAPPAQARTGGPNEPMSPTDTNPYQSPEQRVHDRPADDEQLGLDMHNQQQHLAGFGSFGADPSQYFAGLGGLGALPNLGRGPGTAGDRSQTSSAGPNRGFSTLGGLGQLGGMPGTGWPMNQNGLGTPTRQTATTNSAFGGGLFGADAAASNLVGLGPTGNFGSGRVASMFPPPTMQDQIHPNDLDRGMGGRIGQQHFPGLGDHPRDPEGSFPIQGFPGSQIGAEEASQPPTAQPSMHPQDMSDQMQSSTQQMQQASNAASNQPPPPQQRTMVMPDRMRWIYRDPQGQTQGPWSGLEMHDWYKAGFFKPELLVKKLEDPEYEPLAQLIRRIGNSREPFLVPQIGIPHGQASRDGPNAWAGPAPVGSGSTASTGAQPPFASSFPSFGTTLTAEQQNALERRKQEEQYLMARQKEHLAQAQMAQRMQHHPMHPGPMGGVHGGLAPGGQLHHQHSAQSLHTQPSFGSITSPATAAYQPSPIQAPQTHGPNFFDNSYRGQAPNAGLGAIGAGIDSLGHIREDEIPGLMNRLNITNRNVPGSFGAPSQPFPGPHQVEQHTGHEQHEHQVQQMMHDRARLQAEQAAQAAQDSQAAQQSEDDQGQQRLQQFHQLQEHDLGTGLDARFQPTVGKRSKQPPVADVNASNRAATTEQHEQPEEELTLTEQVQKAASAQQSPAPKQPGFPQPFPPAPSQSPLPAPAAQRTGRQSVADQLQSEERESSQTPSTETASAIAPWAKDSVEAPKGPSLREIQEMEAKRAAEMEELASAARRAAFQKEMEAQAQAQAAVAAAATAGLPAAAKWAASGNSPSSSSTPVGAWLNKTAPKTAAPLPAKTMAQIQKEEEARKKKAAAAVSALQASAAAGAAQMAGGKSYANLASKVSAVPSQQTGGAWTTVGASGKTKTPVAAAPAPTTPRAVSTALSSSSSTATAKKVPSRSVTLGGAGAANAQEEFRKWAIGELRPDLNKGIFAEDFVANLVALPLDTEIITEAVHGVSSTIDSRHFAEEFVRRRRLADKGLVDTSAPPKSASPNHPSMHGSAGGWSEVAKKGPQREGSSSNSGATTAAREEGNGNFRVVQPKKKSGKR